MVSLHAGTQGQALEGAVASYGIRQLRPLRAGGRSAGSSVCAHTKHSSACVWDVPTGRVFVADSRAAAAGWKSIPFSDYTTAMNVGDAAKIVNQGLIETRTDVQFLCFPPTRTRLVRFAPC